MKVQYYSEVLKKFFETEKECLEAEKEYNEKHAAEIRAKEERAAAAKEVESAYKKYIELRAEFIKKYGSWHTTLTERDLPALNSYNWLNFFEDFFQ